MGGTSRMTGDGHVRICERPGVKLPRPTRPSSFSANRAQSIAGVEGLWYKLLETQRVPSIAGGCYCADPEGTVRLKSADSRVRIGVFTLPGACSR